LFTQFFWLHLTLPSAYYSPKHNSSVKKKGFVYEERGSVCTIARRIGQIGQTLLASSAKFQSNLFEILVTTLAGHSLLVSKIHGFSAIT
jgi:hypothetical protein